MNVLEDGRRGMSAAALEEATAGLAQTLRQQGVRVLATLLDNGIPWVVADQAARSAGVVHVPLPAFFTPEQRAHALHAAHVDALLTMPAVARAWPQAPAVPVPVAGDALTLLRLPATAGTLPPGTAKVTFTSGTTGAPKGVCLRDDALQAVAAGLQEALAPLAIRRHLCALPLPVLLENIAGLLAPLRAGATCVVLPLQEVGLTGSSAFDPVRFDAAVAHEAPDSIILLPRMLAAWTALLERTGRRAPRGLRFVAVGGAAVGAPLLQAARAVGIPAYEGYGLSEGASVQTLNLPGADRVGSAGRPLPHARVRIGAGGEVEVAGSLFAGYLGDAAAPPEWWPTGDLGELDADGFLHLRGRRGNVIVTAFGRNVSPEWVEGALRAQPAIAEAVVFGEGQPALSAVVWPAPGADDSQLQRAVAAANAALPDYARVLRHYRARAAFDAASGLATANGRPRRAAVRALHADLLDSPFPMECS